MPPILIALGIIGAYFLVPRNQRAGSRGDIVVTPGNTPVGINGFPGAPQAVASAPLPATGGQTNAPNTAQSGVLSTSIPTRKAAPTLKPSPLQTDFYANLHTILQPTFTPTPVPQRAAPSSGCGGSCGGCKTGCGSGATDCGSSAQRAKNSGCLAPTTNSLFSKSDIPMLDRWLANIASNPHATIWNAMQHSDYTVQLENPPTENLAPPVGYVSPHVGLNYKTPRTPQV